MPLSTAAVTLSAVLADVPHDVTDYLDRQKELRLASSGSAPCPGPGDSKDIRRAVIQRDLTGDHRPDTVFVVMTKAAPHQFGVVALNAAADGRRVQHWVVPLGAAPITGLRIFPSPYADWVLTEGCTPRDGASFRWTGKTYAPEGVW